MPTPIREQAVEAFRARLGRLITGEPLRSQPYDDEDEFLAVWDPTEDAEVGAYKRVDRVMPIAIVWTLKYTADDYPTKLNAMLAQLEWEAYRDDNGNEDFTLGGLADEIAYRGSDMKPPASGSAFISVGAVFEIKYSTRKGDPYSN